MVEGCKRTDRADSGHEGSASAPRYKRVISRSVTKREKLPCLMGCLSISVQRFRSPCPLLDRQLQTPPSTFSLRFCPHVRQYKNYIYNAFQTNTPRDLMGSLTSCWSCHCPRVWEPWWGCLTPLCGWVKGRIRLLYLCTKVGRSLRRIHWVIGQSPWPPAWPGFLRKPWTCKSESISRWTNSFKIISLVFYRSTPQLPNCAT